MAFSAHKPTQVKPAEALLQSSTNSVSELSITSAKRGI